MDAKSWESRIFVTVKRRDHNVIQYVIVLRKIPCWNTNRRTSKINSTIKIREWNSVERNQHAENTIQREMYGDT